MRLSSFSHTGMVRHNNEDACLIIPPWSSYAIARKVCLFAVADGMGGQNAGEVASGISMKETAAFFQQGTGDSPTPQEVEEMIGHVNAKVWIHAQNKAETSGMGNTLTLMLVAGNQAVVGHIGDSRLYRLRDGSLEQLTCDHTLVAEQVRMGKLSPEAARVHPTRHILSRAIGSRQFVTPDIFSIEIIQNDTFMLCSDGISGMLDDGAIENILRSNAPDVAAGKLVEAANKAGGKDNSTAVVVNFDQLPVTFPARFSFNRLGMMLKNMRNTGAV